MGKKPNLYIIQNMMIFMEECFVTPPQDHDYFTFSTWYVKEPSIHQDLMRDILQLFPHLTFLPLEDCTACSWQTVFLSSYVPEDYLPLILSISAKKTILVEDGLFDYVTRKGQPYPFYHGKDLYLFRPNMASANARETDVFQLNVSSTVSELFSSLYEKDLARLRGIDPQTPVLFTTPLSEDFSAASGITDRILKFLHDRLSVRKIILKKHPRDDFCYESKEIDITICPQKIPGQFLDEIFTGKKIFLFPSTVSFMCGELSDIIFLNAMPENTAYNHSFHTVLEDSSLQGRKSVQVMEITT